MTTTTLKPAPEKTALDDITMAHDLLHEVQVLVIALDRLVSDMELFRHRHPDPETGRDLQAVHGLIREIDDKLRQRWNQ